MIRLAGYEPDTDIAIEIIGVAARREAPRGAVQPRRAPAADHRRPDRPRGARRSRSTPTGSSRRVERLRALVASGDEAGLAEHVRRADGRRRNGAPHGWADRQDSRAQPMTDLIDRIGPYLGIAAFLGLAILAFLIIQQAREVRRLREWAGRAPESARRGCRGRGRGRRGEGDAAEEVVIDEPPPSGAGEAVAGASATASATGSPSSTAASRSTRAGSAPADRAW